MPNGVDTEAFSPGRTTGPPRLARDRRGRDRRRLRRDARPRPPLQAPRRRDRGVARSDDKRLHLVVAGDGELRPSSRQRARGGRRRPRPLPRPRPPRRAARVLRASDLFLLTTEPPESFGIVLIEAMACGLPVVASEYPGVRAVVDDGENGKLVPRGDVGAVAAALERLAAAGPEERERIGAAGRAKAEREWTWARLLDRMDETYRGAIETRRESSPGRAARSSSSPTSSALPGHGRPPSGVDGAPPAPARPPGDRPDTAAYGRMPDDDGPQSDGPTGDIDRATDLQLAGRACGATTGSTRCSTPTPTRGGPLPQQADRPRTAGAGLGAIRQRGRRAACTASGTSTA